MSRSESGSFHPADRRVTLDAFTPEDWSRAAFLHEREPDAQPLDDARRAEGERLRATWVKQSKAGDELFERRLAQAGLTREAFLRLLTHPGQPAARDGPWQGFVRQLRGILEGGARAAELPDVGRLPTGSQGIPFRSALRPFIAHGVACLRDGLAQAGCDTTLAPPHSPAELDLVRTLCGRLQLAVTRTLVLELNVARARGLLRGDTPEARFLHFSDAYFDEPGRLHELLLEYQVLARLLVTTVERWVETSLELLTRIEADRPALAQTFGGSSFPGAVTALAQGLSDPHRGGRGVCRVSFESGLTVMYKPRRLANDVVFQRLVAWLNAAGLRHPQRILGILDRGEYGWVEFVSATSCTTAAELERFYWRQGSFLALLHLLLATDFHYENLIAAGEHPVLVDLEGLFHPPQERPDDGRARTRARRVLSHSVFSAGLLPTLIWGKNRRVADLSGLGGGAGQMYPRPLPTIRARDTDEMHVAPGDVALQPGQNRPRLDGRDVDAGAYGPAIAAGFAETHALLRVRRDELRAKLREFAEVEVRYIPRPTMRYALLLQESLHPDYLRDALDRDRVLDRLWAEAARQETLRALVAAEQEDLRLGDVPLFSARPGARDVWDSRGRRLADFLGECSLDAALRRLDGFDEAATQRQVEWIQQAVVPSGGPTSVSQPDPARAAGLGDGFDRDAALAASVRLGEYLAGKAVRGESDVTWIGPRLRPGEHWRWEVAPLEPNLYEGLGGLALFFAHLARACGRGDFEDLARRAAAAVRASAERTEPAGSADVGAFSGRAGAVYVLWHLARLWNDTALLDAALSALPQLAQQVALDTGLDVLAGSAGCAQVMLGLHGDTGEAAALELARACGEHLRATALPQAQGVGWVGAAARLPLAGFAHGVAGIAWTLLRLASATGDERLRATALAGIEYERSLFQPDSGQWLDRREFENAPQGFVTVAWCHGAAGVALGRALALPYLDDASVRDEIDTGIEQTLRQGFGGNQSLCHGDLGAADIVTHAALALGRDEWRQQALAQAGRVVGEISTGQWRTGLPRHTESPGLMTGLSGMGYGLLRLCHPERVPSVLWLEPPRRA